MKSSLLGYDAVQSAESPALLAACFMLVSCLADSSTPKMESTRSSEKLVDFQTDYTALGARGSVVGWGTMLQAWRSPVRIPDEVDFFNLPNPSSRIMALGSTQPLTEMSTRKLPVGKKLPARRADNLAAIYKPNVWKCGSLNLPQP
jgi:hypothetical protein